MSSRQLESLSRADFFTTAHRISAQVQTGPRPLNDLLNDRSQSYLLAFNASVVPLGEAAGRDRVHLPFAYLSKENLIFVLVSSREVRPPERSRYAALEREVLVTLAGFEVRGRHLGPQRADLWNFTPATLDPFVLLMGATARIAARPEVAFSGEVILVNRSRLESYCLVE